jgi:hypothetical protein
MGYELEEVVSDYEDVVAHADRGAAMRFLRDRAAGELVEPNDDECALMRAEEFALVARVLDDETVRQARAEAARVLRFGGEAALHAWVIALGRRPEFAIYDGD